MHSSRMRTVRSSSRLLGGVCLSACWDTHTPGPGPGHPPPWQTPPGPLWTEFLTHTCENIAFPQLRLRTVMMSDETIVHIKSNDE